jgi:acid-sensing ion channel, other
MDFPTVTVCPVEPFDSNEVNFTAYRNLANYDEETFEEFIPFLEMLTKLSYNNLNIVYEALLNVSQNIDEKKFDTTLRQLAFKVAMKCKDLFDVCTYRGETVECCDYFKSIYTERGFCYAFNARYIGLNNTE